MVPPIPDAEHLSVTVQSGPTVYLLIEAEAAARQASRLIELFPDAEAQREAHILVLVAQRLRTRRLGMEA